MRTWTFILTAVISRGILAQTETGSTFKIHVVNSVTGTPIAAANVVLDDAGDGRAWGRTDSGGLFTGRVQSAGKHLLTVTRRGFQMTGGGMMGTMVDIQPEAEKETTVQMLQLGVLVGSIVDQYGDPVRYAIVRILDKMSVPGQDTYYQSLSAATTNDRGEYRILDVEPGKHYLAAEYSSEREERISASRSRFRWPDLGGFVLFPDATDLAKAQQVDVSSGQVTRVNEMHLNMQRAVSISGRVTPFPEQKAVALDLHRAGPRLSLNVFDQGGRSEANGSFTLKALPGTYVLRASDQQTGKMSQEINIEVRDKDLTDIELKLNSGYEINGRVSVDGSGDLDVSALSLNFLGGPVKIGRDGTFHSNLFGNKAHYILQGLPEDWYVKDVLIGGRRVAGGLFEVQQGTTDASIVLSPHGARLEIKTESASNALESAMFVVLLPENGPVPDLESVLHAERDQSGPLVVRGVPPGSYRIFALDVTNWAMVMRPDVLMEKYRKSAPLVTLAEGERKSTVVPLTKILPE